MICFQCIPLFTPISLRPYQRTESIPPSHNPPMRSVGVVIALICLCQTNAFYLNMIGGGITGGTVRFGVQNASLVNNVMVVQDVTFTNVTVIFDYTYSLDIQNNRFIDSTLSVTMRNDTGVTDDDNSRVFYFANNVFSYTIAATDRPTVNSELYLDIDGFATSSVAPLLDTFTLNNNSVCSDTNSPVLWSQKDDRGTLPLHNYCTRIGMILECSTATTALIVAKYNAETSNDACNADQPSTATFALAKTNDIFGDVATSDVGSADISYCDVACIGRCANNVTGCRRTSANPSAVSVGRYVTGSAVFNPDTGLVDIVLTVENAASDAVTVTAVLANSSAVCSSRSVHDTPEHDKYTNRFEGSNRWTASTSDAPVTINPGAGSQERTIQTRTFTISIAAGDECGDTTDGRILVTTHVVYEALDALNNEYTTGDLTLDFNIFFYEGAVSAIYVDSTLVTDFYLFPEPPAVDTGSVHIVFPTQVCLDQGDNKRLSFPMGQFNYTTTIGDGDSPCNSSSPRSEIGQPGGCTVDVSYALDVECLISGAHLSTGCCQELIAQTDFFPEIDITVNVPLLVTTVTAGPTYTDGASRAFTQSLDFRALPHFVDNPDLDVQLTVFASDGSDLDTLNNANNAAANTTTFVNNQRVTLRLEVVGIDYSTTPWNAFDVDLTYLVACGTDETGSFSSYTFSTMNTAGCKGFSHGEQTVEVYMDSADTDCSVDRTGDSPTAVGNLYCAKASDRNVRVADNYMAIGRDFYSSAMHAQCQIPSRVPANAFGLDAATGTCEGFYNDDYSSTGFNDISTLNSDFTDQRCRAISGFTPEDGYTTDNFPECTSANAAATCITAGECGRTTIVTYVTLDIPVFAFGSLQREAPVYINMDIRLARALTGALPLSRRRLLAIGGANIASKPKTRSSRSHGVSGNSITVRKGVYLVPNKQTNGLRGANKRAWEVRVDDGKPMRGNDVSGVTAAMLETAEKENKQRREQQQRRSASKFTTVRSVEKGEIFPHPENTAGDYNPSVALSVGSTGALLLIMIGVFTAWQKYNSKDGKLRRRVEFQDRESVGC